MDKQVRGVTLGKGMPKICVPLVAARLEGLLAELDTALAAGADIVEWRADLFTALEAEALLEALAALRERAGDTPLLFTLRSAAEGGGSTLAPREAAAMLEAVCMSGNADMVDAELGWGPAVSKDIVRAAHTCGAAAILSSHDFAATPAREEMRRRLTAMWELGADIAKLAVMPADTADVLALLEVTSALRDKGLLITMAMGPLGAVSRVAGESFGSCLSFGAGQKASAPGQIEAKALRSVLETLHRAVSPD